MSPDEIQALITKEQQAIQAFDGQIQTARDRGQNDMIPGLENQKRPHVTEMNRLMTQVLPDAQKAQEKKRAEEAAEQAHKEEQEKKGSTGLFG
jgi:hypothetical protein